MLDSDIFFLCVCVSTFFLHICFVCQILFLVIDMVIIICSCSNGMSECFELSILHTLFRIIHTNLPNFESWLLPSLGYMCFKLYQLITTHHVVNHFFFLNVKIYNHSPLITYLVAASTFWLCG